jgi:hypothetical protein
MPRVAHRTAANCNPATQSYTTLRMVEIQTQFSNIKWGSLDLDRCKHPVTLAGSVCDSSNPAISWNRWNIVGTYCRGSTAVVAGDYRMKWIQHLCLWENPGYLDSGLEKQASKIYHPYVRVSRPGGGEIAMWWGWKRLKGVNVWGR